VSLAGELKRLNEEKEEWSARMEDMRRSLTEEHDKHIQEVLEETKDAFEEEHVSCLFLVTALSFLCHTVIVYVCITVSIVIVYVSIA
jgi:Flp pilus assembly protein TadB